MRRFTLNVATDESDLEGVDPNVVGSISAKQSNVAFKPSAVKFGFNCGRGILGRQIYDVRSSDPQRDVRRTEMHDVTPHDDSQFADAADM